MMSLAAFLLLAVSRVALLDEVVRIPASKYGLVDVMMRQQAATIDCEFQVQRGGEGVRLALMTRANARRLLAGRTYQALSTTTFLKSGRFRFPVDEPGEYVLVLDNQVEGRKPADVALKVSLIFGEGSGAGVQELSPQRRYVVIAVSLLVFLAITAVTAAKLRRALLHRRTDEPPLPFG